MPEIFIPRELIDAAYPAALANGIPWHDDAVRIVLAAALPHIVEHIAKAVEAGCPFPDAPGGHGCDYPIAAQIVRDAFKEGPRV